MELLITFFNESNVSEAKTEAVSTEECFAFAMRHLNLIGIYLKAFSFHQMDHVSVKAC